MEPLLTAQEMRQAEDHAINDGIAEIVLMEHAALAVAITLEERFSGLLPTTRGLILAGPGKNGADALAAARMLSYKGASVEVLLLSTDLVPLCKTQLDILVHRKIPIIQDWPVNDCFDWVIDGLFGTGLKKSIEGHARAWIERLATLKPHPWVISVDIPSGLDADTGEVRGVAIRADSTVTFGYLKRGLFTGQAGNLVGELRLDPIQIPRIETKNASVFLFEKTDAALPRRAVSGHKGLYGHAKIWCGPREKQGAAILCAQAALRTGVGLVTLIGTEKDLDAVEARLPPEVMIEVWEGKANASALGVGPGMGTSNDTYLRELLFQSAPLVLDADALTLLSKNLAEYRKIIDSRKSPTVITPHPKEAERILGSIENLNRFEQAQKLVELTGCSVLLKGKGTLVAVPGEKQIIVWEGNSALSRGGAGDMLTGILTGLLAQQIPVKEALCLSAYFEGETACRLSQTRGSEVSLTISEITLSLSCVIDECRAH